MVYGICALSVIPMRAEGNERSEQVSQLLFGETYEILEWAVNWVKIRTAYDDYEGWIGRLQVIEIMQLNYQYLIDNPPAITYQPVTQVRKTSDNSLMYLPATSSLPFNSNYPCTVSDEQYELSNETAANLNDIIETAKMYLNTPYLWGGRTHFGIDCSGYSQAVLRMHGVRLMRDASQQAMQGIVVDFATQGQAGDLAFFDNAEGRITHVGILLGRDRIIHASGQVKIDRFDSEGIYSEELKRYTHRLRIIKRFQIK